MIHYNLNRKDSVLRTKSVFLIYFNKFSPRRNRERGGFAERVFITSDLMYLAVIQLIPKIHPNHGSDYIHRNVTKERRCMSPAIFLIYQRNPFHLIPLLLPASFHPGEGPQWIRGST